MILEGLKIVTAKEMARIEALACAEGSSEIIFMQNAADSIATAVAEYLEQHDLPQQVALLAGKGNNGGDGFAAAELLLKKGVRVDAFLIYPPEESSPLCQTMCDRFCKAGGIVQAGLPKQQLEGIILDGLAGTGFHGNAEGPLAEAILYANTSGLPILAIDIPSGVDGTTGAVGTVAICADQTLFLEFPKIGFFLREGWNHVGQLYHGHFGLPEKYASLAHPMAYLCEEEAMAQMLPRIVRTRHKYQRGYVLAVAGSPEMPGAAMLSSCSALRSGSGIVRLFHPSGMEELLSSAPWELIREGWDGSDLDRIREESKRAKALFLGPGMGRSSIAKKMTREILSAIDVPTVVDADALFFLAENPKWALPTHTVLTPHRGEMDLLLQHSPQQECDILEKCQAYAENKSVTIVLKGAPTYIFHPGASPLCITRGDPGMATAGSGDILTGMIAAMLAQGLGPREAAALAVYLHGLAGEAAAIEQTSYCMSASDILDALPEAFCML